MKKHRSAREVKISPVLDPATPPVTTLPEKPRGRILKEVVEKREKYVKHFFKNDLTFEAAIYNEAVHYFSEGKWKDIDNSLIEVKDENNTDVLENKHNDFKVKIAKQAKAENFITITKEQYEVTWGIDKAKPVSGEIKLQAQSRKERHQKHKEKNKNRDTVEQAQIIQAENEQKITLTKIASMVEFLGISTNVDFQYEIIGDKVKESIIIKEKINSPSFTYNISMKNLVPILQQDRSILFYDDKDSSKGIFIMNPPFMYDGKGTTSTEVQVTLTKSDSGYKLSYLPSDQWLQAKERVYPVTIDPYIGTPQGATSIEDSFIGSNIPNETRQITDRLGVGLGLSSGITRSYIKFTLPVLKSGDMIINAQLNLFLFTANSDSRQVNVHQVTQDWDSASITWNNPAQYNLQKIEDYKIVQGNKYHMIAWDVTSIAKEWYNTGNNYGLMLKNEDETVGYNEFVASDAVSTEQGTVNLVPLRPQVLLTYVNNSGLESYWTYHSQDVRRAGTGYINDYNGNVIFVHNDLSMSGNMMPLTLNHIFNSNDRDIDLKYGPGWRLNVSQRVENGGIAYGVQWYVYTDETGTKHYFYYDSASASYKEQMGLDLTFTINADGGYTIKDKNGGSLVFVPGGYLYKIKDKNDNTITLNYDGIILKRITDGAGRVTTFDILDGYLIGIIDPSARRTSFYYEGVQLARIIYPDGQYTKFTYESPTSNKLMSIRNYDGYQINYTYYTQAPYRVRKVEELGTDGLPGGSLEIFYGYNTTTFVDAKSRKNIYQFNDYGNTISIRDDDGSAGYYKYMSGDFSNKLSLESRLQKFTKNYLKNHNVEASSDWVLYNEPNSTGSSSYTTEDKYLGSQSIKIIKTNNLTKYGYNQPLTLVKGKTYTLSGYIKTKEISNTKGLGATLEIVYQDRNSAWISVNSPYINGTNDWQRLQVKFTLPLDAVSATAYAKFAIAGETGSAYFDCFQFEDGPIANGYNFVENADLSYGQPIPNYWSKNAFCDSNDISTAIDGKMAFRINGSATKTKNVYQTIQISGNAGDVLLISGWAKGASAPISGSRRFSLEVGLRKLDDTNEWHIISFNEDSSDWQYITDRIVTLAAYKSVTLYAEYYYNVNTAYYTNFQLCKEEFGASFIYDEKGNVTSVKDISKQNSTFEYNGNNDLMTFTNPTGGKFTYAYDPKRNVSSATSATNVVYAFTYDVNGNPLTSIVGDINSLFMESTATYSANGNYLNTLKDSLGNTITSRYDELKGVLLGTTDAKGKETSYVYDNMNRITSASKAVASVVSRSLERSALTTDTKVNLITNSSFEDSTNAWILEDWNDYTGKWRLSPDGLDGNYSLECYDSDRLTNGSATNVVAYQLITLPSALTMQKEYTLSAYTKKTGADNPILGIRCFSANGGEITGSYENYEKPIEQNQWSKISNTFKLPLGTKSFFVILRSQVSDNNTVRFDAVHLEEKSIVNLNIINSPTNSELYNRAGGTITNSYTYENDRIKTIGHNGFNYRFEYDGLGRNKKVFVENEPLFQSQVLIENTFDQSTGNLLQSIYGGNANQKINIDYDNLDRVISRKFYGEERYKYGYDNSGNLGYHEDKVNNKSYRYTYDLSDRLVKAEEFSGTTSNINYSKFGYDKNNNHSKIMQKINGNLYETKFGYDKDNKPLEVLYGTAPEDNIKVEYFPLNGSTLGSKGTLPVTQTPVFEKDENDETVLSAKVGTKVAYNLGINKTSGTMTSWFTETGKGTRMILASEGSSDQLLNLYVGANDKVNLAVRNGAGEYTAIITTDETVGENEWNFVAIKWQFAGSILTCTLYLNSKAYTATAIDFKDFTGIQTAVGSTVNGSYPLNGLFRKFSYSSSALSENEILSMYYKNIVRYNYDTLGRIDNKTTYTGLFSYKSEYTYIPGTVINSTTIKVASIKSNNGVPTTYQYDANGNITKITQGIMNIIYYYNELNELIQEDNQVLNKTIMYSYDVGGNLMSKLNIPYGGGTNTTITYSYDDVWKDKILTYNGKAIEHDVIGNLTKYDGYTYTWEEGRQLKSIVGNSKNISYKYNDSGIRTEKNVDEVVTKYTLLGNRVTYETNGTDIIYYTYNDSSNLVSMNLNGIEYYYIKNAQGDIIGLFDKTGVQVVSYTYDSWGKHFPEVKDVNGTVLPTSGITGSMASTVGVKNSYRYRGYRFDSETGLYYLQSRYYNPEWGRFINADAIVGQKSNLLSHNMFAYCKNNPINMVDPYGFSPISLQKTINLASGALNLAGGIVMASTGNPFGLLVAFHGANQLLEEAFGAEYNFEKKFLSEKGYLAYDFALSLLSLKFTFDDVFIKGFSNIYLKTTSNIVKNKKGVTIVKSTTNLIAKKVTLDAASTAASGYSLYSDPKAISNYKAPTAPTAPYSNPKLDFGYNVAFC